MKIRGQFLGEAGRTKKGAWIRKFISDDGCLLAVFSEDEKNLKQDGPITINIGIPDNQLVFYREASPVLPSSGHRVS